MHIPKQTKLGARTILILKGYILHSLKPLLLVFKLHLYIFHASCKHYKSIKMNKLLLLLPLYDCLEQSQSSCLFTKYGKRKTHLNI